MVLLQAEKSTMSRKDGGYLIPFKGRTTLVIDSELAIQELFGEEFRKSEAEVLKAENGATALKKSISHSVSAVETDTTLAVFFSPRDTFIR